MLYVNTVVRWLHEVACFAILWELVMLKSLSLPAAVVDIETTGGNLLFDRITEIGILEIYEDEIREWSTLINPTISIPANIQYSTGITDEMVEAAPRFEQVAEEILLRLGNKLFIAHNVQFDYGFLRKEFLRVAYSFSAPLLCSVKLSRSLYSEHQYHNLDAIIRRHKIFIDRRHRALEDARATYKFLEIAEQEHGIEKFRAAAMIQANKTPCLTYLSSQLIGSLPDETGVYYFWGEEGELLYIGKSTNIRRRVLSHFSSHLKSFRKMQLCQQVRAITWDITPGELGALIRESQKIKELQPIFNRQLRRASVLYSIVLEENKRGWLSPKIVKVRDITDARRKLHGLFSSLTKAKASIQQISDTHRLCYQATGLEARSGRPCMAFQLKRCKGLCAGLQSFLEHNIRMIQGFSGLALKTWPYKGPIALIETDIRQEVRHHFLIHNWCLLGIAESEADYEDIFAGKIKPTLDKDIYRYLVKAIFAQTSKFKVYPLPANILIAAKSAC